MFSDAILEAVRVFGKLYAPSVAECVHDTNRKYKLVVKDLTTQQTTKKRLCSACAKADLENNRVFVALY